MGNQNDKMVLMDTGRIERSLKRMAHQILEDVEEKHRLKVVGIYERGFRMARRLTDILSEIYSDEVEYHSIGIKEGKNNESTRLDVETINSEKDFILMVDDVIFSGRTMFKALQEITRKKLPDHLHCAVLIDRGHRQLPVEAKYIGMSIPTKLNEHVSVEMDESGDLKEVDLYFDN